MVIDSAIIAPIGAKLHQDEMIDSMGNDTVEIICDRSRKDKRYVDIKVKILGNIDYEQSANLTSVGAHSIKTIFHGAESALLFFDDVIRVVNDAIESASLLHKTEQRNMLKVLTHARSIISRKKLFVFTTDVDSSICGG